MAPRGKGSYSQDPLAELGIFFLVGLIPFSVLTKNWQVSSSTSRARQMIAGIQVFSDSFRDTSVKMDPGMESRVSEPPWGTQETQELKALQPRRPAQVLPSSTAPTHTLSYVHLSPWPPRESRTRDQKLFGLMETLSESKKEIGTIQPNRAGRWLDRHFGTDPPCVYSFLNPTGGKEAQGLVVEVKERSENEGSSRDGKKA